MCEPLNYSKNLSVILVISTQGGSNKDKFSIATYWFKVLKIILGESCLD